MGSATTLKIWREQSLLHKLIYDWIFVPIGVAIIIGIVIAVNQLFKAIGFNFPANVAGMLLVAIVFIILEYTIPKYAMDKILMCINPAIDFLMKWMIIFFLPPLITIVNSDLPSGSDIVKLLIVFFAGLIIFIPLVGYFIHYITILFQKMKKGKSNRSESPVVEMKEKNKKGPLNMIEIAIEDEEKTMDITSVDTHTGSTTSEHTIENTITGTHKNDIETINTPKSKETFGKDLAPPKREKPKFNWKSSAIPSKYSFITYLIIYIVSWIPAALWNVTQPLHIATNALSYFVGLCVPDKIRVIFHPLVSCTLLSYLLLWIEALIFGRGFKEEIGLYSNNSKYLLYINDTSLPFPKAGEILFCILDATVVALAFRILEHHKLIFKHIIELVGSIVIMSFLSMLVHTILCRLINTTPVYTLSMTSRSATTPLAVQVVDYLGSDMAIAILIVVFTGVFTDIIGLPLLKLVRFPLKDTLAHGACMGCAGHAVATAGLIKDFPSSSAVSSISFVLFSTLCIVWCAIPPVKSLFRSIAEI